MKAMIIPKYGGPEVLTMVDDYPIPELPEDHVRIEVKATGVNRMDFLVRGGYPGVELPLPRICGGDIAGIVSDIGWRVETVTVGERVLVYPLVSCGRCGLCLSQRPNLCADWKTIGIQLHGGYA